MRAKFSKHLKKPWMSFTLIYILLLGQALGQLPESSQPKLNVGSWIKSLFTLPAAYALTGPVPPPEADDDDDAPPVEAVSIDDTFGAMDYRQEVVKEILKNQEANNTNSKIPKRESALITAIKNLLVTYTRALETKYKEPNWFKVNYATHSQVGHDFWKLKRPTEIDDLLTNIATNDDTRKDKNLILQIMGLLYKKCLSQNEGKETQCLEFAKDAKNLPYPFKDTGQGTQHAYHPHVLQGVYNYRGIQAWINNETFRAYQFLFRPFMCMAMDGVPIGKPDIAAYYYGYGLRIGSDFPSDDTTPHPFPGIKGGCADNEAFTANESFPPESIVVSKIPTLKLQSTDEAVLSAASSLAILQTLRLKEREKAIGSRLDIFRLPLTQSGLIDRPLQITTSFFVVDKEKGTKDIRYVDIISFFQNYFQFMQKGDLTAFDISEYQRFATSVFGDSTPSMPAFETNEEAALKRIFGITDNDASTVFDSFKVGEGEDLDVDLGKYLNSVNNKTLEEMFLPIFMVYLAYASGKTISGLDRPINNLAAFKLLLGSPDRDSKYPPLFFDATTNKILSPLEAVQTVSDFYVGQDRGSLKRIIMLPPLFNSAIQHDLFDGLPIKELFPGPTGKQELTSLKIGGQDFQLKDDDVFIAKNFSSVTGRSTKAALEATTLAALTVMDEQCRNDPEYVKVMNETEQCVREQLQTRQDIQERAIPIAAYGTPDRARLVAHPAPTTQEQRLRMPTMPSSDLVRRCSSPDGRSDSGMLSSAAFNYGAGKGQAMLNMCMLYASIITHFDEQFQRQAPCYDEWGWLPWSNCAWSSAENVLWQIFIIIMALAILLQLLTWALVGDHFFWDGYLWRCITKGQCREWLERDKERQAKRAEEREVALTEAQQAVHDAVMQHHNRSSISPFAQPITTDVLQRSQPSGSPPPSSGPSPTPTTPDFREFDIRFGTPL